LIWEISGENTLTERRTGIKQSLSYLFFALGAAGLLCGFKNFSDDAKEMKAKLNSGRVAEMAVNAQALALHSTRIPELFREGSKSGKSRAKEQIKQNWDDFLKAGEVLRTEVDQLARQWPMGTLRLLALS